MPYLLVKDTEQTPDVGVNDAPDGENKEPGDVFYAPSRWYERREHCEWLETIPKQEFQRLSAEADTFEVPDAVRPEGVPEELGDAGLANLDYHDELHPLAANLADEVDFAPDSRESADLRDFILEALGELE